MILYRIVEGCEKRNLEEGLFKVGSTFVRFTSSKSTTFAGDTARLNGGRFFFCQIIDAVKFYKTIEGDANFLTRPQIYCFEIDDNLVTPADCGIGSHTYRTGDSVRKYPAIELLIDINRLKNTRYWCLDDEKLEIALKWIETNECASRYEKELFNQFTKFDIDLEHLIKNDLLGLLRQQLSPAQIGETVHQVMQTQIINASPCRHTG